MLKPSEMLPEEALMLFLPGFYERRPAGPVLKRSPVVSSLPAQSDDAVAEKVW